jgi:aromatic ring-opening dioxygenase catalytic subunit (LigB family)
MTIKQPTIYLPHGGGPCFFMDWTMGPKDTWDRTAAWLRSIGGSLPETPASMLVVSAHWEETLPTVTASEKPTLLYDYSGFPKHTYELTWPAPASPDLSKRVRSLLEGAGIPSQEDDRRGFDHGVFVPLKVAFPEPTVPVVQLSLRRGLDPAEHIAIGRALAPLRDEGVLILGSGMSYHNMRGFMTDAGREQSTHFAEWLAKTIAEDPPARDRDLTKWTEAPDARACHPREEHLLPLMVVAGAAGDDRGREVFRDNVMGVDVAAVRFGV